MVSPPLGHRNDPEGRDRFPLVPGLRHQGREHRAGRGDSRIRHPWALTKESEELFDDPDFRGINPKDYPVTQEQRDVAWNNSRIFRKAGGTQVPLGIYRTPDNQFVPIFGDATAEEIRKIVGIG